MDVLATVLEEMPPFPEKESSGLLNLLKKKQPGRILDNPDLKNNDNAEKPAEENNGDSAPKTASEDLLCLGLDNLSTSNNANSEENNTNNLKK